MNCCLPLTQSKANAEHTALHHAPREKGIAYHLFCRSLFSQTFHGLPLFQSEISDKLRSQSKNINMNKYVMKNDREHQFWKQESSQMGEQKSALKKQDFQHSQIRQMACTKYIVLEIWHIYSVKNTLTHLHYDNHIPGHSGYIYISKKLQTF